MLTRRILACLDMSAGRVVKGKRFVDLRDAGDPAEQAARHAEGGADEVVLLDVSAAPDGRATLLDVVRRTAATLFVPFTVGGGIRSLNDAGRVFDAGADKITLNSAALDRPDLISEVAARFGSQAVVVAIDARLDSRGSGEYEAWAMGGRRSSGRNVRAWAREAVERGAGEILLTAMDRDGTGGGFDCELTEDISGLVPVPIIASGGGGRAADFVEVFTRGKADAALAASIFHFGITDARALKTELARAGVPVRLPC